MKKLILVACCLIIGIRMQASSSEIVIKVNPVQPMIKVSAAILNCTFTPLAVGGLMEAVTIGSRKPKDQVDVTLQAIATTSAFVASVASIQNGNSNLIAGAVGITSASIISHCLYKITQR